MNKLTTGTVDITFTIKEYDFGENIEIDIEAESATKIELTYRDIQEVLHYASDIIYKKIEREKNETT